MKSISTFKNMALICALTLFSFGLYAQTIITIDNNPGSTTTYQTLQDAHDNATAGDTIYVQPSGSTYGNVTLIKPLTIIGRSHSEPGKQSQIGSVLIGTSGVALKGLEVSSISVTTAPSQTPNTPPFVGLDINECRVTSGITLGNSISQTAPIDIDDVQIRGNVISGITVNADATDVLLANNIITSTIQTYNTTSFVITNNIFRFISNGYIYNYNPSGTLIIYNNMFLFNTSSFSITAGKMYLASGSFNLSNNLTYNYGSGNDVVFQGQSGGTFLENGTLANTDPLFTDVDPTVSQSLAGSSSYNPEVRLEDDLTLQATSPALTGGGGGSEIGLYNNGFMYSVLGNPSGYPLLDVLTYDGAVPKNGNINVTIKAVAK